MARGEGLIMRLTARTAGNLMLIVFWLGVALFSAPQDRGREEALRQEEQQDYYQRWLKEDVVYIITDEEEAVFNSLSTPEEKEKFIEQFWHRRDPDPRTAYNEFKEEHYRRIAYANEHFSSGDPGWMTDRGMVYIIHGPPDNIESRPSGGFYQRDISEGGGTTATYPFERWRYRRIEGLGEDIILEFVDSTWTGKYQLAVSPWEKDALLHMPGAGKTLAEQTGLATRGDRSIFIPGAGTHGGANPQLWFSRYRDTPFQRYELAAKVSAPAKLKYPDLKEVVQVNLDYNTLPFDIYQDYFRLNEAQVLIPITIRIQNKNLTFQEGANGFQVARMAVYGIIKSMTNRIVHEFDDDLATRVKADEMELGLQKSSVYQKVIPLDSNMRYRLDLVVKDLNSGQIGVVQTALIPPDFKGNSLSGSSLVLSDYIQELESLPNQDEMFVLGDVKIRPNVHHIFSPRMPLGIYYQVYNAAIDQTTFTPALRVTYRLYKDGELLRMAVDEQGDSIQFYSGQRIVLVNKLSLDGLEPGEYSIELDVEDLIGEQSLKASESFSVVSEERLALSRR